MLLSLDVGTSSCKAIVFNRRGDRIAFARERYPTQIPKLGWMELNPTLIWACVKKIIKKTSSKKVQALSVTSFGDGVTPVSKNGKSIYNIISALDLRAAEQQHKLQKKMGLKKIFMITGQHLHPMHIINKINWFYDNKQDIYNKTWKFLQAAEFINYKFTRKFITDLSLASKTSLFDVNKKRWSETLLEAAAINHDNLPTVGQPGEVIGEIDVKIAKKLGLSKNTQVVLGGHDSACAAFGAGVIKKGIGVDVAGTWEILRVINKKPLLNDKMFDHKVTSYCHVTDNNYAMGGAYASGAVIDWYLNFLGEKRSKIRVKTLIRKLSKAPSTIFILPHFAGSGTPYWDPKSRGAILGLHIGINNIEVFKALLESLVFELTENINCLEDAGLKVHFLRAAGGGADEHIIQLKADVTGKIFQSLKEPEVSSLGAAMLAGLGIKEYSSPKAAVQEAVKLKSIFHPQKKVNKLYSSKFKLYSRIYPLLKDFNSDISDIQMNN